MKVEDPLWLMKWKKAGLHLMEKGCCTSIAEKLGIEPKEGTAYYNREEEESMIKGYRTVAYGYKAKFFYNLSNPLDSIYIVFDSVETVDNFKDGARRLIEAGDGRLLVNEILRLIEVDPSCNAVEKFKNYYWGPEVYWIQEPTNRLTLKFPPPKHDYEATIFTPRCSGRYPWNNDKGGITPMNTTIFKNTNAYKTYMTFIDKLRCNGAEMDMRMSMRKFPDITINTNTVQILHALEAIQPFDIPEIVDYKFYADRVTIVKFADGTYTKCEVQGEDKFDPDTGIIFCVVKKMLGAKGHDRFNDILRKAHAAHEKVEADKQKTADEKRARKEKAAKLRAKKLEKEEEQKRQAIDIQKQAYVEAIAEVATKKPATRGRKKVDKE